MAMRLLDVIFLGKYAEKYHQQCPDTVVNEDGGRCDEHGESNEFVEL